MFVVLGCVVFESCSFVLFMIDLVLCCDVEEICKYMYFFTAEVTFKLHDEFLSILIHSSVKLRMLHFQLFPRVVE